VEGPVPLVIATLETPDTHILRSPGARRLAAAFGLLAAGGLDYVTGPAVASAPFYIFILVGLAFYESFAVCLAYSFLAAGISLASDLLGEPTKAALVYPYWAACARLIGFALISGAIALLVQERKRLRESERALLEKTQELQAKHRRVEETLREVMRLQENLVARDRQAAIGDTIYAATYELEQPLASASVYIEEATRLIERASSADNPQLVLDQVLPLLEKLENRIRNIERILREIRGLHKPNK
jgi:hypothetical protein